MKDVINRNNLIVFGSILIVFVLLGIFVPNELLAEPLITPNEYLGIKPTFEIGNVIIIVPSSTIIVYLLGIQIGYIGYLLVKDEFPLWGSSLLLWGLGTILAGTSYQGFGYMLKCSGNDYCTFTSWFELAYLFVTALSIGVMGLAFCKMFVKEKTKLLNGYSKIAILAYTLILVIGSIIQNRFMISYELFTIFFMPLFLVFFVINIVLYKENKSELNKRFIHLWMLFLIVNASYYIYYFLGFTESLYNNYNIWFSANDVLHVGLMFWFGFFLFKVKREMIHQKI
jgi:hypothetical protein